MNYRRIWEQHNNKTIPDCYEIHHIDSNHNNNEPSNLLCVSLQEHLNIHLDQKDWGAVQAILMRMDTDKTLLKLAASKAQKERYANKTHNWIVNEDKRKKNLSLVMQKRIQETGNAFTGISDRIENSRHAGKAAAAKKAGFLNTSADHHGSKAVKNTTWWTDINGNRKRSLESPGIGWSAGMKYKEV